MIKFLLKALVVVILLLLLIPLGFLLMKMLSFIDFSWLSWPMVIVGGLLTVLFFLIKYLCS